MVIELGTCTDPQLTGEGLAPAGKLCSICVGTTLTRNRPGGDTTHAKAPRFVAMAMFSASAKFDRPTLIYRLGLTCSSPPSSSSPAAIKRSWKLRRVRLMPC